MNTVLTKCKRIVVKVGSSLVTNQGAGLDLKALGNWARQIAALNAGGHEVVHLAFPHGAAAHHQAGPVFNDGKNRIGFHG